MRAEARPMRRMAIPAENMFVRLAKRFASGFFLLGVGALAHEVFNDVNVRNSIDNLANGGGAAAPLFPPTQAELIEEQMSRYFDGSREIITTVETTKIQVEVEDGIFVRDFPLKVEETNIRTGIDEPFYQVESYTGNPMKGIFENYVHEWDRYNPRQLNKIWAARWIPSDLDNGGAGRLEYVAVFDKDDGGCLVSFTNPKARQC